MEKYEWSCPVCNTYHAQYISEWDSKECKGCHNKFYVNMSGVIDNVWNRHI